MLFATKAATNQPSSRKTRSRVPRSYELSVCEGLACLFAPSWLWEACFLRPQAANVTANPLPVPLIDSASTADSTNAEEDRRNQNKRQCPPRSS
jgi:hypothetical protein